MEKLKSKKLKDTNKNPLKMLKEPVEHVTKNPEQEQLAEFKLEQAKMILSLVSPYPPSTGLVKPSLNILILL